MGLILNFTGTKSLCLNTVQKTDDQLKSCYKAGFIFSISKVKQFIELRTEINYFII